MNQKQKTCEDCGATFVSDDTWYFQKLCDGCSEKSEREHEKSRQAAWDKKKSEFVTYSRRIVSHATPEAFRITDTTSERFNLAAWTAVKEWTPKAEKPWIGLLGPTGLCKTRMAFLLATKEMERLGRWKAEGEIDRRLVQPTFRYVPSYEITEAAAALKSFQTADGAREFLDEIRKVDLLLLDDLGKGSIGRDSTGRAAANELFSLIDYRSVHLLFTIWTSNSKPEDIASRMDEDIAAPFAGRLYDFSRIVDCWSKTDIRD